MSGTLANDDALPINDGEGWKIATCHCGRVSLDLPSKPDELNECRCTICFQYGALWAYYPRKDVTVTVSTPPTTSAPTIPSSASSSTGSHGIQKYIREDKKGERSRLSFNRCGNCGVLTHWWGESGDYAGDDHRMGVNCRLLGEKGIAGIERHVSYE
ncbi:hypothetical protein QBC46DRAFT_304968 [Diplogelasinospora grovesii]|uniref:CENP-V/GFA domain-containing protein n=1 Tax=Diplogelasinospora grovesii TaxID=303347 RepID=A0AAN6NHX7_9PEZI|nr:hypothetical protein QBC46DRAFT_304968 [Diplogelasinospora grovesii]